MGQLKSLLPNCETRLFTHTDLSALNEINPEKRLHVVIRYGSADGRFAGFLSEKIADVAVVPVVGNSAPSVSDGAELLDLPLIKVIGPFQGWTLWQAHFGLEPTEPNYALETDSYHSAMLAVERGEGACLAVLPFASPW